MNIAAYERNIQTKGFYVEEFSEPISLVDLVSEVGRPVLQDHAGTVVWDIRPLVADKVARSLTMEPFPLHTDASFEAPPPRYVAMYVVREDRWGGGITALADTQKMSVPAWVEKALSGEVPLYVPAEFWKGEDVVRLPLRIENGWRYRREVVEEVQCTRNQREALDYFDAESKRVSKSLTLLRHSVIFMDNHRMLHGRTRVHDPERRLQRVRYDVL